MDPWTVKLKRRHDVATDTDKITAVPTYQPSKDTVRRRSGGFADRRGTIAGSGSGVTAFPAPGAAPDRAEGQADRGQAGGP